MEKDPRTFFLTDFLVKSFEKLVWEGLKIDKKPELLEIYFKNYKNLIYLSQIEDIDLQKKAEEISRRLKLVYEYRFVGFGHLKTSLSSLNS